jgi:hypothetical protein
MLDAFLAVQTVMLERSESALATAKLGEFLEAQFSQSF